jgi:hypothetical protein
MIAVLYDLITASIVGFQLLLLKILKLDLFLFKAQIQKSIKKLSFGALFCTLIQAPLSTNLYGY